MVEGTGRQFQHFAPPPDGDAETSPYPDDLPFLRDRLREF